MRCALCSLLFLRNLGRAQRLAYRDQVYITTDLFLASSQNFRSCVWRCHGQKHQQVLNEVQLTAAMTGTRLKRIRQWLDFASAFRFGRLEIRNRHWSHGERNELEKFRIGGFFLSHNNLRSCNRWQTGLMERSARTPGSLKVPPKIWLLKWRLKNILVHQPAFCSGRFDSQNFISIASSGGLAAFHPRIVALLSVHHPRYASEIRIPAAPHSNVYIDHILCLRILLPDFGSIWLCLSHQCHPKIVLPPSFEAERSWWFVEHRFCWLSFSPFRSQTLLMIEGGFLSLRPKLPPCPRLQQLHYENSFCKKAFTASTHHSDVSASLHYCLFNLFSFPLPAELHASL